MRVEARRIGIEGFAGRVTSTERRTQSRWRAAHTEDPSEGAARGCEAHDHTTSMARS